MKFENIIYYLIALLVLVWPMPHIIAIRNIDIVLLFLVSSINFYKHKKIYFQIGKMERIILFSIIGFVLWAIFLNTVLHFQKGSLYELKPFSTLFILAISAYFIINSNIDYKKVFLIIFSMLMLFIIYHFLFSIHFFLTHHHKLPFRSYGITVGLDELNFMMPYVLTFFSVEIIFRFIGKETLLSISNTFFTILLMIALTSLFIQAKRNGIISITFMIASIIFFIKLVSKNTSKKLIISGILGAIVAGGLIFLNIKDDSRWKTLIMTAKVVFIQGNMDGLTDIHGKLPILPNGQKANNSNYERLFMFKEGIKLIYENPIGYGFIRNIYGKAMSKKYHVHIATHSHSGMIDWGIGVGVIGLGLWSIFIFGIIYLGFKNFILYGSYFGLFILYLSTSFYFRMFLDSINKDHMLQQFIFFLFLGFFALYRQKHETNPTST